VERADALAGAREPRGGHGVHEGGGHRGWGRRWQVGGQRGGPLGRGGERRRLGRAAEWERRWRRRCRTAPTREKWGSFVGFLRGFSPLCFRFWVGGVRGIRELRGGQVGFARGFVPFLCTFEHILNRRFSSPRPCTRFFAYFLFSVIYFLESLPATDHAASVALVGT
jgi:hypothetical protein